MADIKIQDAATTTHAALTNKIPVYDGTLAATVITPEQIIDLALDNSLVAPPLGADDNYVTDAEKTKLSNLSGTNTGDQDLTALNAHLSNTSDPHQTTFDQLSGTLAKLPLNTSLAAQTLAAGEMAWNPDERCFDMGVNGVTLQAGQEQIVNVRNSTASQISNGTVCMATGTIGASGRITVAPMDGTNPANAMYLLGIATEDIAAGQDGFVTAFGKVRGVDTSAYEDGDVLYTSTTTPGALTKTAPTSGLKQPIAFVVNAASNGIIFVRIETLNHLAFQANGIIVTDGDGNSYLANDGTYKAVSSGITDHGNLSGLLDDDHIQYLNETRHDLLDHTGLTGIPTAYTDEMAKDAVGALISAGTQSGITVTYDDANNKIDFTVTATGTGDVTGPASSVDSNFALFNGTTGKIIKDGSVKASDFATASHNHTGVYQPAGTYSTDIHSNITALNAVSGTNTGDQDLSGYSLTSHNHAGVYEPADATILKDADIGVTVQAYDADLTSWAAIAPSAKQDTLISGTNIKTINGSSILGSGDLTVEGGSGMSNPMTTAGDMIYGGTSGAPARLAKGTDGQVLTLASGLPSWAAASEGRSPYAFFKSDTTSVAFTKTAAQTLSIKAGTFCLVGDTNTMVSWATATAITMPTHTIGTDYYIYACTDGTCRADANASAPTGYTTANSRKIGGYHYGRIRNSLTVTDVATEIVPRSLWDLTYRPKCNPAGMTDVYGNGSLWADIYLAAVDSAITLTNGVVTAGTCKSIYNGTPLSGTEGLHGYNFIELAKNSGKRLLTHSEWLAVAHGSPQGNNDDNLNAWSATTNVARNATGQVARAVSFCGATDCVGNLWEWLDEWSNRSDTTSWNWYNTMTGQNVGQQYLPNSTGLAMYLTGGYWAHGVIAGSRALYVITSPWLVYATIGSRFACDGL